jgi:Ser/Thr protein kinase RdoA (MazF antagonist)
MAAAGVRPALALDPAVPARDLLLDPRAAAARLEACLDGETVERSERLRVNYRVGESLRVLYAVTVRGRRAPVSVRTFRGGRGADVFRRALETAVPAGPLPAVAHDDELDAVFWAFPNDRRIRDLTLLGERRDLGRLLGRAHADARLVAYVPESCATARCVDDQGRTLAFAKVYAGHGAERARRLREALPDSVPTTADELRLPRLLATSAARRTLLLEPLDGLTPLDPHAGPPARSLRRVGAALAALHGLPVPAAAPRFDRLDSGRLHTAAGVIGLLRPELAPTANQLAVELDARRARAAPAERAVCLHGDPHLHNALVQREAIALVDLDDVCAGPPAADLARVLAVLAHRGALGDLPVREEIMLSHELLSGYARERTVPEAGSLRWHVAATLLVRHAAKSLSRFRPRALARIEALLARAEELIV